MCRSIHPRRIASDSCVACVAWSTMCTIDLGRLSLHRAMDDEVRVHRKHRLVRRARHAHLHHVRAACRCVLRWRYLLPERQLSLAAYSTETTADSCALHVQCEQHSAQARRAVARSVRPQFDVERFGACSRYACAPHSSACIARAFLSEWRRYPTLTSGASFRASSRRVPSLRRVIGACLPFHAWNAAFRRAFYALRFRSHSGVCRTGSSSHSSSVKCSHNMRT